MGKGFLQMFDMYTRDLVVATPSFEGKVTIHAATRTGMHHWTFNHLLRGVDKQHS